MQNKTTTSLVLLFLLGSASLSAMENTIIANKYNNNTIRILTNNNVFTVNLNYKNSTTILTAYLNSTNHDNDSDLNNTEFKFEYDNLRDNSYKKLKSYYSYKYKYTVHNINKIKTPNNVKSVLKIEFDKEKLLMDAYYNEKNPEKELTHFETSRILWLSINMLAKANEKRNEIRKPIIILLHLIRNSNPSQK